MGQSVRTEEVFQRIRGLQHLLQGRKFDGAIIIQKVALYYFSGTDQDAHLWIPAEGDPLLMVRKSVARALQDSLVREIVPLPGLSRLTELIRKHEGGVPGRIGLELDVLPVNLFRTYERIFRGSLLEDVSPMVREARTVKSPRELDLIRRAAEMGDRLLGRIPEFLEGAETETDLAVRAETFYREEGHPGLIRMRAFNTETLYGQILSGPSIAVPSWTPGPTSGPGPGPYASQGSGRVKIAPHTPILVDYVANVEGYMSDQARIYSKGRLAEKYYRAHQVMIEIQDVLADRGRPGVPARDLYDLALRRAEKAGLALGFMGHPQSVPFVGHGIGLELDEWPVIAVNSDHILGEGSVIALEPKYIFPGEGAAGIENTFVVGKQGMEKLNRFPEEIQSL